MGEEIRAGIPGFEPPSVPTCSPQADLLPTSYPGLDRLGPNLVFIFYNFNQKRNQRRISRENLFLYFLVFLGFFLFFLVFLTTGGTEMRPIIQ